MMLRLLVSTCLISSLIGAVPCRGQEAPGSPIPDSSGQMVLVLSKSFDANVGWLRRFERQTEDVDWAAVGPVTPITLGRNGLGLGSGLHEIDPAEMPIKQEGDGKSPAGAFRLSSAFGYAPVEALDDLEIRYTHVTESLECVDDVNSVYYNQIVLRDAVDEVDWESSEQMLMPGIWYEKGIVVDHNASPVRPGAGSCIFLHNWSGPEDTTAGCTAMAPSALTEIVYWLDSDADPVLVQLTESLYEEHQQAWGLPGPFSLDD